MHSAEIFSLPPTHNFLKKKLPEPCSWQVYVKERMLPIELFFFHVELWAENTNPKHRHILFAFS